ncbi:MAG: hypothetical protein ACYTFQ_22570 [Planctomycetota bacterium]|jgi:hypothetical protein
MGILKKMRDKKWFQALQKIAPKIAAAAGGPFGGLAENVLEEVLGVNSDEAMEQIAAGSPEVFERLRQAEIEFEQRMAELEIEEQDLYLKDVADARAMRTANRDYTPAILTGLAVVFFGVLAYAILWDAAVIDGNEKFVWYLLGTGNALLIQCYNFFMGSSRGSQRKTDILANGK